MTAKMPSIPVSGKLQISVVSKNLLLQFGQNVFSALKFSASKSIFQESVRFERRLCEIIFFVIIKVTPTFLFIPLLIYTNFIYFTSDVGPAAFELLAPMWWAFAQNHENFIKLNIIELFVFKGCRLIGKIHWDTLLPLQYNMQCFPTLPYLDLVF